MSTLTSGLSAFVLSGYQLNRLEVFQQSKLCALCKGSVTVKPSEDNSLSHHTIRINTARRKKLNILDFLPFFEEDMKSLSLIEDAYG